MGTYQTLPETTENFWNLIKFSEHEEEGALHWLMRKDQCMHCAEPGCLIACPAPGAIVQYTNGIVDFQQDQCIGCGYCMTGCPFNVPKFSQKTRRVYKCTHVRRSHVGRSAAGVREGVSHELSAVRHQGGDARDRQHARGSVESERVRAGGRVRSARRGRHERRHGARVRRSARAVRAAAESDHPACGAAVEGSVSRCSGISRCSAGWSPRPCTSCASAARIRSVRDSRCRSIERSRLSRASRALGGGDRRTSISS